MSDDIHSQLIADYKKLRKPDDVASVGDESAQQVKARLHWRHAIWPDKANTVKEKLARLDEMKQSPFNWFNEYFQTPYTADEYR